MRKVKFDPKGEWIDKEEDGDINPVDIAFKRLRLNIQANPQLGYISGTFGTSGVHNKTRSP